MFGIIFLVSFHFASVLGGPNQTAFYVEELRGLSELPMDRLIEIRSSINEEDFGGSEEVSSRTLPVALPLRGSKWPMRRYEEHYEQKGNDTKISKIFQLAVTSLSFLAFGGYLLTLIITAIRRNSGIAGNGNVIVLSNLQNLQKYKRPKRDVLYFDPLENDWRTRKLYEGMIMLSQAYAQHY